MMWNRNKKSIRIFRILIVWGIILCMLMTGEMKEYGTMVAQAIEDAHTTYVSDIRLFYAPENREDAVAKCKERGFIPVDGDLNTGTSRNCVVMGYKETDKKEEAICSIRLLAMNAGFEMKDYAELQKEYESSNAAIIDTIEAAAIEFTVNYKAGSPKAVQAYEGLNLINVPEANDKKLGDYIVDGDADWDFYAKIATRSSSGTINAILGYLSTGLAAYENGYDSKTRENISVSWAGQVKDSSLWEDLEETLSQDEYDELYREYGDDAKAFHKKLQEYATAYENAKTAFDASEYAEELEKLEGMSDEEVVEEKEELSGNEQGAMFMAIYEELDQYEADGEDTLADYLLSIGNETSEEVDLTRLYPVIDSMSYAERRMAGMSGLPSLIQTAGENEEDEQVEETISEAATHIKELIGKDSYSVWMNNDEEIKGKKVAYTSDAIRMNAAQQLLEKEDHSVWSDQANEVMKWVNTALGIVSCLLVLAKFAVIAKVIALVPAGICAIAAACGLTCAATTVTAIAGKIAAFAGAAGGPVGWITLAVLVVSMLVIWAVSTIMKYIKENKDYDYDDAPDYVADRADGEDGAYIAYYKGAGSEMTSAESEAYHGTAGIGDVNGRRGFRGWNCIFYSKDGNTGSPIVVKGGEVPFKIINGGSNPVNGYDSVKSFGEIMPGNCNALMKEDKEGGVFIHYRTEKSIKNISETAQGNGEAATGETATGESTAKSDTLYYSELEVRSASTEEAAKAKLTTRGFNIWDVNLANNARFKYSQYQEWAYTYLGFKTTKNSEDAIRDIRVATFTPQAANEVKFGEITYACAGNLGYKAESKTEDKEYPEDLDGLWFTKNKLAGTPIALGGLHLEESHADGKYINEEGWVPVTTFSGVPYNFASTRCTDTTSWKPGRLGFYGYSYTCYGTTKDDTWNDEGRYLYYEPETKYTSGTKYLSAVFFTFGTDSESTASKVGETTAKYTQLIDRMKKTPNTVILDNNNLAKSFVYKGFIVESNQKYLHLGYSWSYNPYRALTDIRTYQTTIFANNLPYTVTKPSTTGKNYSYASATVISQRTAGGGTWVMRGIGPENAYMFPTGLLGTNEQVQKGYTMGYQPGGYAYSRKNMPFIASGLYVSGPVDGAEKLTLEDVVITKGKHKAENNDGVITADVSGEKTLAGEAASGEFNSIQEMKDPYETEPFNIAYPAWTDDNGDLHDAGEPCYIYIRRPAQKRKYISKIFVGSSSFDDTKMEEDEDTQKAVGKQIDANALNQANAAAQDEVIPVNVALNKGRAWYDTQMAGDKSQDAITDSWGGHYDYSVSDKEDRLPYEPPSFEFAVNGAHRKARYTIAINYLDRPASYLSVERTDDPNEAVRGLLLFQSKEKNVAEKIQVGGVDYYCASPSTPIQMRKLKEGDGDDPTAVKYDWEKVNYFLYYTTNKGVAPGVPITEITADEEVFTSGQMTVLCVDKKDKVETVNGKKTIKEKAAPYGDTNLPLYIHASYEKDANMLFNKIYTASGKTRKEALLKLLETGCTEFCDMNLNEGASLTKEDIGYDKEKKGGEYIYFGYRGYTPNPKGGEEELIDAVYDIVCTVDEPYQPNGIMTDKHQIFYTPVTSVDDSKGVDLNAGTNGPAIYMYYTTPWVVQKYNEKVGTDSRKNRSTEPKTYLKSPLTRICFTRYDRVPYSKDSGVDAQFGDDKREWEYVLYSDNKSPVDFNDGAIKLGNDFLTENNRITMFAQRQDGSVKASAEITGGYVSSEAEVGEMWLNR